MNIFTNDDIDFSKDFYKYLSDSYNSTIQENKLKDANNKIIKENIAKLEQCIKSNLKNDNTLPFDKTFVCIGFKKLKLNNNDVLNTNPEDNIEQFYNPMEKLQLHPTVINQNDIDFKPNYMGKKHCGDYVFNNNIIPKNSFAWLTESANYMIVRVSNIKTENNNENDELRYPVYWS